MPAKPTLVMIPGLFMFFFVPILVVAEIYAENVFSSDKDSGCLHIGVGIGILITGLIKAIYAGASSVMEKILIFMSGSALTGQYKRIFECLH